MRWGGEEFVLVLPGTPARGLEVLAHRVLEAIGAEPVDVGGDRIPVTVSVGCAVFPLVMALGWEDSLHVADLALYLSKSGGRNLATCVTAVAADADVDLLLRDLGAARAAGHVELQVTRGPSTGADERADPQAGAVPVPAA